MKYVNKNDLTELITETQLRKKLSTLSLPRVLDKITLDHIGYAEVPTIAVIPEDIREEYGNIVTVEAIKNVDDTYGRVIVRKPITEAEAIDRKVRFEKKVREKRDGLLSATDKYITIFTEKGITIPEDLKTYRQALRDMTLDVEFPFNAKYPTLPTGY